MLVQSIPFPAGAGGSSGVPAPVAAGGLDATTTKTVSPSYPSGVAANRYAILHAYHFVASGGAATFTTPSGWTLINTVVNADWRAAAYYLKLTGAETGTVPLVASKIAGALGVFMGIISIWDGVDPTTPIGTSAVSAPGNNAVWTGNSITTTVADARVVNLYAGAFFQSSSAEAGWTELYNTTTPIGGDGFVHCTYKEQLLPGNVAAENRQGESDASPWTSISFDLRPIPSVPRFTVIPSISSANGFFAVGDTLTGNPGTHNGLSQTLQWNRDGVAIGGATGTSYTLTVSDLGANITFAATATNSVGSTTRDSAPVGPIGNPVFVTHTRVAGADTRIAGADTRIVTERTA